MAMITASGRHPCVLKPTASDRPQK